MEQNKIILVRKLMLL